MSGIRTAGAPDIDAVVDCLAEAFFDDPVFRWWIADDAIRRDLAAALFRINATYVSVPLAATFIAEDGAAAAIWVPPGEARQPPDPSVYAPLFAAPPDVGERGATLARLMEEHHPHTEHWYLPSIGVRPGAQGRGLGSALLAEVLERCERDRVPAYLEASSTRSRSLYERHGFVTQGEIRLPDGPSLWPMWREPRPAPDEVGGTV